MELSASVVQQVWLANGREEFDRISRTERSAGIDCDTGRASDAEIRSKDCGPEGWQAVPVTQH